MLAALGEADLRLIVLAVGVLFTLPSNACVQSQMAGYWNAYSVGEQSNASLGWTACFLVIDAKGNFTTAASACADSQGREAKVRGTLKLQNAAKCLFSGSITAPSLASSTTVKALALAINHETANGIGGGSESQGAFVFNMTKAK